ncbi:MAG: hypothetical protein JSW40_03865, partial [Candidatus Omnitrophota bacterium]
MELSITRCIVQFGEIVGYGKKSTLLRCTKPPQDIVALPPSFRAKFDNFDAILKVDFSLLKNRVIVSSIR